MGACYAQFLFPDSPPWMKNLILFRPSHPVFADCLRRPRQPAQQQGTRAGWAGAIYSSTLEMCIHRHTYRCPCWIWHEKQDSQKWIHLSLAPFPPFHFFRNFPSMVSDFPAILLPPATSNLIPVGIGTGPTPSSQIQSPREDALGSILTQSLD